MSLSFDIMWGRQQLFFNRVVHSRPKKVSKLMKCQVAPLTHSIHIRSKIKVRDEKKAPMPV